MKDIIIGSSTLALALAADGLGDSFGVAAIAYLGIVLCCWYWDTVTKKKEDYRGE